MIAHNFMGIFVFVSRHFCGVVVQGYRGESTYHNKNWNRIRFDVIKQYSLLDSIHFYVFIPTQHEKKTNHDKVQKIIYEIIPFTFCDELSGLFHFASIGNNLITYTSSFLSHILHFSVWKDQNINTNTTQ